MPVYELTTEKFNVLAKKEDFNIPESELQRLIIENISVIEPDSEDPAGLLVIAEEFGDFEDAARRIDILCVDKMANLVVVELKRKGDGDYAELQALRYGALISTMTFGKAVDTYQNFLNERQSTQIEARKELLEFFDIETNLEDDSFFNDVRLILVSPNFSKEITSTALWLNERSLHPFINCVKLEPYRLEGKTLVNVQQIIPLPDTSEYQVMISERAKRGFVKSGGVDRTKYNLILGDDEFQAQSKRKAMYHTLKYLLEAGVVADELNANIIGCMEDKTIMKIDPESDIDVISQLNQNLGRYDAERRYFCKASEFITTSAGTYVISGEWARWSMEDTIEKLKETFADYNIEYSPIESQSYASRETTKSNNLDRTKYDLILGEKQFPAQSKRKAMYRALKYLLENGVKVSELNDNIIGCLGIETILEVDRESDTDIITQLNQIRGRSDSKKRFFCKDDELVTANDRTFAISGEWARWSMEGTLENIKKKFPEYSIQYNPV